MTAEVSPEMRTVINTDPEQPTPVKSQVNLPDLPDAGEGSPLDEPEREDERVMDLVGADVLSDLPVGDDPGLVEQREESDEPASKISSEDDRTDVLPQDNVVDQRNPQSDQTVVDQVGEGVLRRSQRCTQRSTKKATVPSIR